MPRPSNTQERQEQIVNGLLRVMSERGYHGATIPEIAKAAGLTPGLVHYHFESKRQVLLRLVELLAETLRRRYESRLEKAGADPKRRLAAFIDAHLATGPDADPRAVACWVTITAEATREVEVREVLERALEEEVAELETLVKARLEEEDRSTRGARGLAVAILAAIQGAVVLASAAPDLVPDGFAAPSVQQMVEGLITAVASRRAARPRR